MRTFAKSLFSPACGVLAAWGLAALALGSVPGWMCAAEAGSQSVWALELLTAAMVLWMMCGVALCSMRRCQRATWSWGMAAADGLGFSAVMALLFSVGCWFANASALDALRCLIVAWCFYPLGVGLGGAMARRRTCSAALAAALICAAVLPAMGYFALEFSLGGVFQTAGTIAPVSLAWRNGALATGAWQPMAAGAMVAWLAAGVLLCGVAYLGQSGRNKT
ncbi:MAG: hypothetical protein HN370_06675 [Phycisphaerales bacterium]|jgi:hypothetical protein|nr:hypothetical protein [Phycisphaerales bacterium]